MTVFHGAQWGRRLEAEAEAEAGDANEGNEGNYYDDDEEAKSAMNGMMVLIGIVLTVTMLYGIWVFCKRRTENQTFHAMSSASKQITSTFELDQGDDDESACRDSGPGRRGRAWMLTRHLRGHKNGGHGKAKGYIPPPSEEQHAPDNMNDATIV
jgi:hypothetical protein|uniref:Uncharacterized protein n=1 Tax=Attheya septentrionalis TaxID=420275 RepID=A0A7S2UH29_9STRA|mmetsp:Transcript_25192/g.45589  ORF Transcript_25192/g.45589 Transcript_25192/m.45589 type:complete len:154 (+) Transcript_25192:304-765(+)|eukprot:CAMPEP_0198303898 /NCGR_PEP_ID=MMETSP1449-20131203/57124_1 /TAXON_ID=420275 /ORGANISM="Attheya septentrionalis, Strain CCMP2084" /LENGTH=153 /DNA_ID=CAMNT_0044006405 /DNA_START=269 /DNA_END=730 /DNA_ORIENTATION=+